MVLVQKWPYFKTFFFVGQYKPGKCLLRYSRTKKRFSRPKKQEDQKVQKLTFFQMDEPMVLVQKWAFFQLFLFRQYSIGKCRLGYSRNE